MYYQSFLISERYRIYYNSLLKHQRNFQKQDNGNHNIIMYQKTFFGADWLWTDQTPLLQEYVFLEAQIIKEVQTTLYSV